MEGKQSNKVTKKEGARLLKVILKQWAEAEDQTTRVTSLVQMKKLCELVPSLLEKCMKDVYLTYSKYSRQVIEETIDSIRLMRNCVAEIYSMDATLAYQHAFIYIRQLAILLRNALQSKSEEDIRLIYNWQYVNSLNLWTHMVTESTIKEQLQPLVFPLVQIIDSTIRLIPASRFYPLRLHCCQMLIDIAQKNNVHIPIAPYLIEIINDDLFLQKPQRDTTKPPSLDYSLKFSKTILHSRTIQDIIMSKTLSMLNSYISFYQDSIAYPELVFCVVKNLKNFSKECKVQHWKDSIKSMLQKFEKQSNYITVKRETLNKNPVTKDTMEIDG